MSMNQMNIRNSTVTFRTSSQGSSTEGVKTDLVSLDEYDRIDKTAEQSAIQSMGSSKYKMLRRWSTPSAAGYGVDGLYKKSDQRQWQYKCEHCGKWQQLDYEKNIKLVNPEGIDLIGKVVLPGTYQYVCRYCGKLLDRWYNGQWVVTAPGQGRTHGYSISQMDCVWISASALKQVEMNSVSKTWFYNYCLGRPYTDDSNMFHEEDVLNNMIMPERPKNRDDYSLVSCGIDWGQHNHSLVFMGLKKETREIDIIDLKSIPRSTGVADLEKDLKIIVQEIRKFNPDIILPDLGYNGNYVAKLTKEFGARKVFGVKVRSAKSNGDIKPHFNTTDNTVTIDKLMQNLLMMSDMHTNSIKFWHPMDNDLKLYMHHWSNVVIRSDDKTDPRTKEIQVDKVITRKGDGDHLAQASVYCRVGLQELLNQKEELEQNKVLTTTISDDIYDEPTDINKEISELNFNV